jgi:hypothetical protein
MKLASKNNKKNNWWKPFFIERILAAVHAKNGVRPTVKALKEGPLITLFEGLDESTMRGWFKKRESPTGPFILTKEAQDKLKVGFSSRGGQNQITLFVKVS